MSEIFREVDEALREDRAKLLWRRYGRTFIAAAIAVVIGTAAYVFWQRYEASRMQERSVALAEALALAQQDLRSGAAALDASAALGGSQATLAAMIEAGLRARIGETSVAAGLYRQVAGDADTAGPWRDLALLQAIGLEADGGDPQALAAELSPLLTDDNALRHSARELSGVLAMQAGDLGRARTIFTDLSQDAEAPPGVRTRAAEMAELLDE